MLNSQILDVAIGLVFLYFFLGLFCSVIIEGITALIKKRPRMLSEAINLLLGKEEGAMERLYKQPLFMGDAPDKLGKSIIQSLLTALSVFASKPEPKVPSYISSRSFILSLLESLKQHPNVVVEGEPPKSLNEMGNFETKIRALPDDSNTRKALLPLLSMASSDPANMFESIKKWYDEHVPKLDTVDNIQKMINKLPDDNKIKKALVPLLEVADKKDLDKALGNMEKWYDEAMERVTGWYKRYAQSLALILAFVVALALNADTFAVGKALYSDPVLRSSVVAMAESAKKPPPTTDSKKEGEGGFDLEKIKSLDKDLKKIKSFNLPLGWPKGWFKPFTFPGFLGIVFTAFMVSLGSNFWFELLNKLINLRNAGKKPLTKEEEAAQKK